MELAVVVVIVRGQVPIEVLWYSLGGLALGTALVAGAVWCFRRWEDYRFSTAWKRRRK